MLRFYPEPTPEQAREIIAAYRRSVEAGRLLVLPDNGPGPKPHQPSGLRDETECPAEHSDADVVRHGCYSCGAAV